MRTIAGENENEELQEMAGSPRRRHREAEKMKLQTRGERSLPLNFGLEPRLPVTEDIEVLSPFEPGHGGGSGNAAGAG